MKKTAQVPYHLVVAKTRGAGSDQSKTHEEIFVGGVYYDNPKGTWVRGNKSQHSFADLAKMFDPSESPPECESMGDQVSVGQNAIAFRIQFPDGESDLFWIAKANGLLLRMQIDKRNGDEFDLRVDYSNIRPPSGVR